MHHPSLRACAAALLLVAGAAGSPARAQTGPGLWLKPFGENQHVEAEAVVLGTFDGDTSGPGSPEVSFFQIEAEARVRFAETTAHPIHLGYELFHVDFDTDDPGMPQRLSNHEVAIATKIATMDDWSFAVVAGGGFAGSLPFSDSDAVFGRLDLIAVWQIDEKSQLQLILNYHGNRTIWPDVPIPNVAYMRRSSETLTYIVGIPSSQIHWQPAENWFVSIVYVVPISIDASISFSVHKDVSLFVAFKQIYEPFHLAGDDENRRLFFEQSRVEAGVRVEIGDHLELVFAAGYAFAQEISRGWDARDTTTIRELSDEPYIRGGLIFRY